MLTLARCLDDKDEDEEAQEDDIELLESREDAPEALQPAKQAFHLVATPVHLPVVHPRVQAIALGRDDMNEAEVEHQLTGLVILVGAIHHQRRRGCSARIVVP